MFPDIKSKTIYLGCSVFIVLVATTISILINKIQKLNSQIITKNNKIRNLEGKPESNYKRFETIKDAKELKYGYVEYKPFFWKDGLNEKGIGYELLKSVFSVFPDFELKKSDAKDCVNGNNWNDIFINLCAKKFDIILTPLFETRRRIYSHNIAYCSPLFYSNIGIYIKREAQEKYSKMSFIKAIEFLKHKMKNSSWKPEYIVGELSETMIKKYFPDYITNDNTETPTYPANDNNFTTMLDNICNPKIDSDFVFMEVFKANSLINRNADKLKLINILKDNQLLYPVSFVVRKEDTVLRNLINLRLLELKTTGDLEILIKKQAIDGGIEKSEFNDIFIQGYDFSKLE